MSREETKQNLVKCSNKTREDRKMTGRQKKETKNRGNEQQAEIQQILTHTY